MESSHFWISKKNCDKKCFVPGQGNAEGNADPFSVLHKHFYLKLCPQMNLSSLEKNITVYLKDYLKWKKVYIIFLKMGRELKWLDKICTGSRVAKQFLVLKMYCKAAFFEFWQKRAPWEQQKQRLMQEVSPGSIVVEVRQFKSIPMTLQRINIT